ncbi:MAG: hypothetical protein ACFFEO_12195 [Candidatus Thorarchaeota archaeon]
MPINFDSNKELIQFYPVEAIFSEIKDYFKKKGRPDYIWLKGVKNMDLFYGFQELLKKVKREFPNQKLGVYVNCSLFRYELVRRELSLCDLIVTNLNTVNPLTFFKSCVCDEEVNVQVILDGIKTFRKEFKGPFRVYTILIKDVNNNLNDILDLKAFLLDIKPDHFSVNIFTGNGFESISNEFKNKAKDMLKSLPFKVSFTF